MVLIIEDEKISRKALTTLLVGRGYAAQGVESAEEAIWLIDHGQSPNIALVDLDLPGINGAEFIRRLKRFDPTANAVLITASDEDRVMKVARNVNTPYLRKPIDIRSLLDLLVELSPGHHYPN